MKVLDKVYNCTSMLDILSNFHQFPCTLGETILHISGIVLMHPYLQFFYSMGVGTRKTHQLLCSGSFAFFPTFLADPEERMTCVVPQNTFLKLMDSEIFLHITGDMRVTTKAKCSCICYCKQGTIIRISLLLHTHMFQLKRFITSLQYFSYLHMKS